MRQQQPARTRGKNRAEQNSATDRQININVHTRKQQNEDEDDDDN